MFKAFGHCSIMERTPGISQEEIGLNLDIATLCHIQPITYPLLPLVYLSLKKSIAIKFIKYVMHSFTWFTCINSLNPHNNSNK